MSIDLERYFDREIILTRFATFEDLRKKMNKKLESYNLYVKNYDMKTFYDNDFEDFNLIVIIGNDKEDLYDLDIWFAITRIGERIIVETTFEGV